MSDLESWCIQRGHQPQDRVREMTWLCACGAVSWSTAPGEVSVTTPGVVGVTEELRDELHETKTPVVDEVVNSPRSCERSQLDINREQQREKLRRPPRGKAKWVPHDTTIEEILDIATVMDAAEHLLHYRVRCSELGKKPNDTEWIRWFIRDQQNLVAANKLAASARESETSDDGTPLSWKN